ncbi:MAG: hypothetical protein ISS80_00635 [Candidatus Cloacimonetes bacterium]|nr:hypothetical protein [Candidatus Cloacimonadota bacterium]
MKNKLLLLAIIVVFLICSCTDKKSDSYSLVKKRITQKIEINAMGMINDLKIESIETVNDSTFKGVHTFFNPIFDKSIRVTENYFFTTDLDSIKSTEDLKTEMKSQGEWVDTGF